MIQQSIFPVATLDRNRVRWTDYLHVLTPVERLGELMFKRDDLFAPLGFGSINGSKCRQCLWLVHRKVQRGCRGLVTGASILSPQHSIVSTVANHLGIPTRHVIGATNMESARKYPSIAIAELMGARFEIINVAYNPMLQRHVKLLLGEPEYAGWDELQYGITIDHRQPGVTPEDVEGFHLVGAEQVKNLPEDMEYLIIPSGSCNTLTSILYGMALYRDRFPNLKRIISVGIGPSKLDWAEERLAMISYVTKLDAQELILDRPNRFEYFDLHKVYKYTDRVKAEYHGLALHGTYEAKCAVEIQKHKPELLTPTTVFWIVGSEASFERTKEVLRKCA